MDCGFCLCSLFHFMEEEALLWLDDEVEYVGSIFKYDVEMRD